MSQRSWIDVNSDCGESFGNWRLGNDAEMFHLITTANMACGFHAGDPVTMLRTVLLAKEAGVVVGAHPGLPDLLGFGRRMMTLTPEEVFAYITYQVGALQTMLTANGMELHHVKPHGALFTVVQSGDDHAEAAVQAIVDTAPEAMVYLATAHGSFPAAVHRRGLPFVTEMYPDLKYLDDGSPVIERSKAHVDPAEVAAQVRRFVEKGVVRTMAGSLIRIEADTVAVHGDGPNAVEVASAVKRALEECGCQIRAATATSAVVQTAVQGARSEAKLSP